MNAVNTSRIRLGACALGISAILFALFPLVRPYFPRPSENSPAELTVASQTFVMPSWIVSHFMAMAALVLLMLGMLTLHAFLTDSRAERRAFVGMICGLVGIALILPTLGVETYVLPVLGDAYLNGKADLAYIVGSIYSGPDNFVLLLGLLILAISAVTRRGLSWWAGSVQTRITLLSPLMTWK